jgi:hypothetical protein
MKTVSLISPANGVVQMAAGNASGDAQEILGDADCVIASCLPTILKVAISAFPDIYSPTGCAKSLSVSTLSCSQQLRPELSGPLKPGRLVRADGSHWDMPLLGEPELQSWDRAYVYFVFERIARRRHKQVCPSLRGPRIESLLLYRER